MVDEQQKRSANFFSPYDASDVNLVETAQQLRNRDLKNEQDHAQMSGTAPQPQFSTATQQVHYVLQCNAHYHVTLPNTASAGPSYAGNYQSAGSFTQLGQSEHAFVGHPDTVYGSDYTWYQEVPLETAWDGLQSAGMSASAGGTEVHPVEKTNGADEDGGGDECVTLLKEKHGDGSGKQAAQGESVTEDEGEPQDAIQESLLQLFGSAPATGSATSSSVLPSVEQESAVVPEEDEIEKLRECVKAAERSLAEVRAEKRKLRRENKDLREEVEAEKQARQESRRKVEKLQKENDRLQEKVVVLKEKVVLSELEEDAETRRMLDAHDKEARALEAELQEVRQQKERVQFQSDLCAMQERAEAAERKLAEASAFSFDKGFKKGKGCGKFPPPGAFAKYEKGWKFHAYAGGPKEQGKWNGKDFAKGKAHAYPPAACPPPPPAVQQYTGQNRMICFERVPPNIAEEELKKVFSEVGPITTLAIADDGSRLIAWIVFDDKKDAAEAEHRFNGGSINDITIKMTIL
ncbi:unnamed protein product [Amoebophrya sp. A120]|nr:unnamed protein product [Amoebophrya sp. A120]|eukprot:GSA120T00022914001.1